MTTSKPSSWSKPSRAFRIELRASRALAASLAALGLLGIPAWWLSDAPRALAVIGATLGVAWAAGLARREARTAATHLVLHSSGVVEIDGHPVDAFDVTWRGPLFTLVWTQAGRTARRVVFPDALESGAARELRLWALSRREDAPAAAVAP